MAIFLLALLASGAYLAAYLIHSARIRNGWAVCGCALLIGFLALCALPLAQYWIGSW